MLPSQLFFRCKNPSTLSSLTLPQQAQGFPAGSCLFQHFRAFLQAAEWEGDFNTSLGLLTTRSRHLSFLVAAAAPKCISK